MTTLHQPAATWPGPLSSWQLEVLIDYLREVQAGDHLAEQRHQFLDSDADLDYTGTYARDGEPR
jgi:hypothetical protein